MRKRNDFRGKDSAGAVDRIEIRGDLDRHAAEALYLEIRRVARRYGLDIREFRVEKVTGQTGGSAKCKETGG